ncbi:MAG: class I SAM-dependent methyltransferase [Nitrospiraceae bacterium]|nr:class I SAM-dependent methyltransferase [Nitrospiraceae bacterium]
MPEDRDARCLDIACGAGMFLNYLKERGYRNITGVDISSEQVALAKQVCDNVSECDFNNFLTDERKFELITIFSFIEHLTRDEAMELLDNVHRALAPGGRVILITPNADSPFASHMRYGDVTHEVIYNQSSLSSLLRACGFTNCRAFETGPVPHGLKSGIRWALWKIISGGLKAYRLIEGGSSNGWIFTTEFIMVADKFAGSPSNITERF